MFSSKLKGDSFFRQLKESWVGSDTYKDLTEKMTEKVKKKKKRKSLHRRPPPPPKPPEHPLNFYLCQHCNKKIDIATEIVYSIRKEKPLVGFSKRDYHYHAECFEEIAGEEFM